MAKRLGRGRAVSLAGIGTFGLLLWGVAAVRARDVPGSLNVRDLGASWEEAPAHPCH